MSSSLRRRLRKVLAPAPSRVVRVADGEMTSVAGMCTVLVGVAGHEIPVMFAVVDTCPHDIIIIGLIFLADHPALIDCASGVLQLELPSPLATAAEPQLRLRSTEHICLAPKAVTYLPLTSPPPVPDGDYIVSPVTDVLLDHHVALPVSVVTVAQNQITLPLLNFGLSAQVLVQGIALALLSPFNNSEISYMALETAQVDKENYHSLEK